MPPGTGSVADAKAFSGISGPTAGANSKTRAQINSSGGGGGGADRAVRAAEVARLTAANKAADQVKAEAKAAAKKAAAVDALAKENAIKKSNNPFSGVGDWFSNLFGDTSNDTEEEKSDPVGTALGFLGSPVLSIFKNIIDEAGTGMNDIAKDEWALLNQEAARDPNSPWHTMSDAQKAYLARKPQMDDQLPNAFIQDGISSTANEDQLDAIRPFIKDLNMSDAQWNNLPIEMKRHLASNTKVNSSSGVITGGGGGGAGQGNQNLAGQAPASPNWWEEGYVAPIGGAVQPPWFSGGGVSAGQQTPGLPGYLQNELAATPDFTGSYQSSLLGNTALPSQQITGLLAPAQQQPQQYNFTAPQQQPQVTLEQLKGLLGGYNGFIG